MGKLIDCGKFWDNLNAEFEMGVTDVIEAVNNALDNTPTVDAVPVIRCKDCKKYWDSGLGYGQCEKHGFDSVMPDDFCSYSEPVNKPVESVDNLGGINND